MQTLRFFLFLLMVGIFLTFPYKKISAFEPVEDPSLLDIFAPLTKKQAFTVREMFELSTAKKITNHLLSLTKKYPENFKLYEVLCQWSFFLWRLPEEKEEKLKGVQAMKFCAGKMKAIHPDREETHIWSFLAQGTEALTLGILETFHRIVGIKEFLDKAQGFNPTYFSSASFWFPGRIYYKLPGFPLSIGDPKKAELLLESAIQKAPGYAPPYVWLAEVKYFLGEKESALKLLDRIPQVKPTTYYEKYAKWASILQGKALEEILKKGEYDRYRWDPQLVPVPPPPEDW